jgi:hypothetical protein
LLLSSTPGWTDYHSALHQRGALFWKAFCIQISAFIHKEAPNKTTNIPTFGVGHENFYRNWHFVWQLSETNGQVKNRFDLEQSQEHTLFTSLNLSRFW